MVWFCFVTVGNDDEEFTIEMHHGGFFVGHGHLRAYVDGKVSFFYHVEVDTWSPLWMDDLVSQLDYPRSTSLKV